MQTLKNMPFAQAFELNGLIDYRGHRIVSLALSAADHADLVLFAMDRGESISAEFSSGLELIAVLEGSLQISIGADTFTVGKGGFVAVPPLASHAVKAAERCKFLQIGIGGP